MSDIFKVLEPGACTTVQDEGRFGWQRFGVPPAGTLDIFAGLVANMLVGNPQNSALLEITFTGPKLEVLSNADIAVTGALMPLLLNGKPVPVWQTLRVFSGDILEIGMAQSGCRAYLAVSGGIDVPAVMNSRSCYVGAAMGGFKGRPLQSNDVLKKGDGKRIGYIRNVPSDLIPSYTSKITLRAIPGPQDEFFDEGLAVFFDSEFKVSPKANRMGYRLQGPVISQIDGSPKSIISEPSLPGGVQIPQDGQPIILLTEQTVGGYTKIATVISADIPKIAQATPGDMVRFVRTDIEAAHKAYRAQKALLERIMEKMTGSGCVNRKYVTGSVDWNSEDISTKLISCLYQI